MPTTTPRRSALARLAANERWAREPDRQAVTAPGRAAADDRFLAQAREIHPNGDEELIRKAAGNLRAAFMARIAHARWGKAKAGKAGQS